MGRIMNASENVKVMNAADGRVHVDDFDMIVHIKLIV